MNAFFRIPLAATHCFDKQRAERAGEMGEYGFQDAQWRAYKCRTWNLRHLAAECRAAGQDREADDFLKIIKIARAAILDHLGKRVIKGKLVYRPPPADKKGKERLCRLFGSSLGVDLARDLAKQGNGDWRLRLVEGEPSPRTDSIHGAAEEDRLLFEEISLLFRKKGH